MTRPGRHGEGLSREQGEPHHPGKFKPVGWEWQSGDPRVEDAAVVVVQVPKVRSPLSVVVSVGQGRQEEQGGDGPRGCDDGGHDPHATPTVSTTQHAATNTREEQGSEAGAGRVPDDVAQSGVATGQGELGDLDAEGKACAGEKSGGDTTASRGQGGAEGKEQEHVQHSVRRSGLTADDAELKPSERLAAGAGERCEQDHGDGQEQREVRAAHFHDATFRPRIDAAARRGFLSTMLSSQRSSFRRPGILRRGVRRVLRAFDVVLQPMRRAAAQRRLSRLEKPTSVQFICHGNVCRSPYAEYAFRRAMGEGVEVSSAGFIGPGRPSPTEALSAASRLGIDLGPHRSKLMNTGTLRDTSVLVVMDAAQRSAVASLAGRRRRDVVILGDLDPARVTRRAIQDPWGQREDVFDEVYARIDRCVAELAAILKR